MAVHQLGLREARIVHLANIRNTSPFSFVPQKKSSEIVVQ